MGDSCPPVLGEISDSQMFQFYIDSFFRIPRDIKNDIIYCQRALITHMKVHQMVIDVFQHQPDADPQQKRRILEEIELEIYEINAEQQFLFLRLHRVIQEFSKMLHKNGVPMDYAATYTAVSKDIISLLNNSSYAIVPVTVYERGTEEKLIERYFEVQKDVKPCEIIDLVDDTTAADKPIINTPNKIHHTKKMQKAANGNSNARNVATDCKPANNSPSVTQMSLLKPMNQRISTDALLSEVPKKSPHPYLTNDVTNRKQEKNNAMQNERKPIELPVSKNVKISRMNLRQALKRAQAAARGPMAAAQSTTLMKVDAPTVSSINSTQNVEQSLKEKPAKEASPSNNVIKKTSGNRGRNTRSSTTPAPAPPVVAAANTVVQKTELTSSSGEGTPDRGPTPPNPNGPNEFEETRTKPEEYGQEMFLRIFDLFTPEIHVQLQQRRSKRRRRCVQNNTRSFYHYGKVEQNQSAVNMAEVEPKKKRKAFLLSPQVKKNIPNKRAKRRSGDKMDASNSEATQSSASRSTSSSPDEKPRCNECLKRSGVFEKCGDCKSYYHPTCHMPSETNRSSDGAKICPPCLKMQQQLLRNESVLHNDLSKSAKKLELQLAKECDRQKELQRTSKLYKIQMNNLFKIVKSLKIEQYETDDDGDNEDDDDYDEDEILALD